VQRTKIPWTDAVWNPITGCSPISPGCEHCYAKRMANRLRGRFGYPKQNPFAVTFHPDRLEEPLRWRKPRRIFVCSMGDIAHEEIYESGRCEEWYEAIWRVMARCPQHTFMLLTKRPEGLHHAYGDAFLAGCGADFPLPNVWVGVTAEDQEQADKRIPIILSIPAAVHFVSVEPMLSEIQMRDDWLREAWTGPGAFHGAREDHNRVPRLGWMICGAETGPGARPMDPLWAERLYHQCKEAGVPFFFKKASKGLPVAPECEVHEFPKGG